MKINKKFIFSHCFKEEAKELEKKVKEVKMLNEALNEKNIELKCTMDRVNKLIEENTSLRRENGELRNGIKKAKEDIINSNEYKTLLSKYNELISRK